MKNIFFLGILLFFGTVFSDTVIVLPEKPTSLEEMAAKELVSHFKLATGKKYSVAKGDSSHKKKIYIGTHPKITEYLKKIPSFGKDEWLVQAFGENTLIITGEKNRGVIYGVYEFLENELGVLWLDEWSTHVPRRKDIAWKSNLKLSGQPSFRYRGIYSYFGAETGLRHRFQVRNRLNHFHDEYISSGPARERGVTPVVGSPRPCHTFFNYTSDWGEKQEALFSWSEKEKRYLKATSAYGPGQVCMSNPETSRLFTEKLRNYITSDIKIFGKESAPEIYVIAPNDNISYCECKRCKALIRKYGSNAGLLIRFVNTLAENIRSDYPKVKLMTTAYVNTKDIPKGILPDKNVLVQIAFLGSEFSGERRDTHHSWDHPNNRESADLLRRWSQIASIAVWDYWVLYQNRELYPSTNTVNLAKSLEFYKKSNISFVFAECGQAHVSSLHALRYYIGMRKMYKADLDTRAEIIRFMNAYYGKAAPMLLEYHDMLQKRNDSLKSSLGDLPLSRRTDLDKEFFERTEQLLSAAENAAEGNPVILERIRREWIPVYRAMFEKTDLKLSSEKRKYMTRRLLEFGTAAIKKYLPKQKQAAELKKLTLYTQGVSTEVSPLKGFENKDVIADYTWQTLRRFYGCSVFDDPDATCGRAVGMIGKEGRNDARARKAYQENRGIACGVYDYHNRRSLGQSNIPAKAVPQDEKYHWYFAGRFRLTEKCFLWMHWSWLCQLDLGELYDPTGLNNEVDIYISIKVSGKNYSKGSSKPNAYAIDRVVICRSSNGKDPTMKTLPSGYEGRICAFEVSGLALGRYRNILLSADPDSVTGTALCLSKQSTHAGRKLMIGIYDEQKKKVVARIIQASVPADEKYHTYSLGVIQLPESGYIFAHASCLLRVDLSRIWNRIDAGKKYEVIVSVKAEGPSYVNGSGKNDSVSIDRVLLLVPEVKK